MVQINERQGSMSCRVQLSTYFNLILLLVLPVAVVCPRPTQPSSTCICEPNDLHFPLHCVSYSLYSQLRTVCRHSTSAKTSCKFACEARPVRLRKRIHILWFQFFLFAVCICCCYLLSCEHSSLPFSLANRIVDCCFSSFLSLWLVSGCGLLSNQERSLFIFFCGASFAPCAVLMTLSFFRSFFVWLV